LPTESLRLAVALISVQRDSAVRWGGEMTRWTLSVCMSVFVIMASLVCSTGREAEAAYSLAVAYEPHDQIVIMSDEDFTLENGVRSGNGTRLNPYVIEGWEIDLPECAGEEYCSDGVVVQNTESSFVIRDMWIHSGKEVVLEFGSHASAIVMYHVWSATMEDCVLSNNTGGIYLMDCSFISIEGCLIADNSNSGIFTEDCEYVRVANSMVARNSHGGVEFGSAEYCDLIDSTVTGSEYWLGVNLYQADHSSVRNCIVSQNNNIGVNIGFCQDCNVSGNLIEGNSIGACIYGSERLTMESNVYLDNGEDIRDDRESEIDLRPAIVMAIAAAAAIGIALFLEKRRRSDGTKK